MKRELINIFLLIIGLLVCCKKENYTENKKDYDFLVTHVLTQKTGWIDNLFILTKEFEKVSFKSDGNFEVIYKSPGKLHLVSADFYVDTIRGNYSYDQETKKITFMEKDSLVYLPGQLNNLPDGGTLYLIKADWYIKNLIGDTIKIQGISTIPKENEINIWYGTFYLEPLK